MRISYPFRAAGSGWQDPARDRLDTAGIGQVLDRMPNPSLPEAT